MPGAELEPGWWARGLALHERLAGLAPAAGAPGSDEARAWLASWRASYGADGSGRFAARLAATGLDENSLLTLLTEPRERLAARIDRPTWADTVERAIRAGAEPDEPVPADWRAAFARPLRPLVDGARARLAELVAGVENVELAPVLDGFAGTLRSRLVDLAAPVFVAELATARAAGRLTGADPTERFAGFVRGLATPAGLAELCAGYPVLARLLGQACVQDADALAELLIRFAADRPAIVSTLLGGVDPGPVVAIESGRGDRHAGGRTVAIVRFGGGQRVVYRPREVESHLRMATMIDWLNRQVPDLELRSVSALARPGYGWLAFVDAAELAELAAADRFYRRQGALLALLHALHAGDMHYENLIAAGEWPVLVDVETLFHPTIVTAGAPEDVAAAVLADSVHRTALLPMIQVGEHGSADLSGLGGDPGGALPTSVLGWADAGTDRMRAVQTVAEFRGGRNRPRLAGRDLDPGAHEAALLAGFRLGYDAILWHIEEFAALLDGCADLDVRLIARPTRGYLRLLEAANQPDLLRDAADRDRLLDVLWTEAIEHPLRWRLSGYELTDLWAGDVPLFTTRPGGREVRTADATRLPDLLAHGGLRDALSKVRAMSEVDRRDQEWIISATLATRRPAGGHRSVEPMPGPVGGTAAHAERLLAAACAVGDKIVAASLARDGRVNWLGLEFVEDRQWLVLPMGAGLASGYPGVALFLAQLADVSGIPRYAEVARSALAGLPALLDVVAAHPHLASLIGSGALHGFGGIAYALARFGTLLNDAEVRGWARTCAGHAAGVDQAGADWATGGAGCLAALTAVRAELGDPALDGPIRECARRLAARADGAAGPGFAFGAAGIGWALARAGSAEAARIAVTGAGSPGELGWCSGLAGIAMTMGRLVGAAGDGLDAVVPMLSERPVLRDLSLCHGELGIAEALTLLSTQVPAAVAARRRRAGLVLDAIDRYGLGCGTPGGVPTPGLLYGLAGIGYGLLRLGFADLVPSVLVLEPGRN